MLLPVASTHLTSVGRFIWTRSNVSPCVVQDFTWERPRWQAGRFALQPCMWSRATFDNRACMQYMCRTVGQVSLMNENRLVNRTSFIWVQKGSIYKSPHGSLFWNFAIFQMAKSVVFDGCLACPKYKWILKGKVGSVIGTIHLSPAISMKLCGWAKIKIYLLHQYPAMR